MAKNSETKEANEENSWNLMMVEEMSDCEDDNASIFGQNQPVGPPTAMGRGMGINQQVQQGGLGTHLPYHKVQHPTVQLLWNE